MQKQKLKIPQPVLAILKYVFVILIIILILKNFNLLAAPVAFALVIAYWFNPLICWLEKKSPLSWPVISVLSRVSYDKQLEFLKKMKGFNLVLVLVCFFSSPYLLGDDKNQIHFDAKPAVDIKHLNDHSKSLYQIYSQIIPLINELNRKEISNESMKRTKTEISILLKKAVRMEPNPKVSDYLYSLSGDIVNDDFTSSHSKWLDLENVNIDFILRFHKKQKKYETFVLFYHTNLIKTANQYISHAEKMKVNTVSKFSSSLAAVKISDRFAVADLLDATASSQFLLLHPPAGGELNKETRKIIVFRNVAQNFFDRIIKPVSETIFDVSLKNHVRFKPLFSYLILHQIAHYLGPYFVQSKTEQPMLVSKKLKNLFACIEQIKADSAAICAIPVLKDEKISFLPSEKRIFATYVAYLIARVGSEAEENQKRPFLIELNFLFKNNGLIFNLDTDVILIDFEKFRKVVNKMMGVVVSIEQSGRYSNAKQFINEYTEITPELKRVIKRIENVPEQGLQ